MYKLPRLFGMLCSPAGITFFSNKVGGTYLCWSYAYLPCLSDSSSFYGVCTNQFLLVVGNLEIRDERGTVSVSPPESEQVILPAPDVGGKIAHHFKGCQVHALNVSFCRLYLICTSRTDLVKRLVGIPVCLQLSPTPGIPTPRILQEYLPVAHQFPERGPRNPIRG